MLKQALTSKSIYIYIYAITLLLLSSVVLSSCGTIFKGSNADIRVNSSPAGATIYVNDINKGLAPQTLSLKRNRDYTLTFKKEGYADVTFEVNKKI